ncbi:MAG TPA: YggS family pyridoxal phosphate-dependent enzyme [Halanaerobiales bacterium]|nr:YggS family pyridoxal phosphate-dependent enzyme [Halanaerobiales bacterium]
MNMMKKRMKDIKKRIESAASRAKRDPASIKLIAVSKNQSLSRIKSLNSLGINKFAENRVQEMRDKYDKANNIEWHFIGHLQRNKVKYLLRMERCKMIHSVDSHRLLCEINKRARKNKRVMPVLIEVNIAKDRKKFGFSPEAVADFLTEAQKFKYIDIRGLMTIVPYIANPEETRLYFRAMNSLIHSLNKEGFSLTELSMGMTNDFEIAIEEGSTMVRVGTGLFGKRVD